MKEDIVSAACPNNIHIFGRVPVSGIVAKMRIVQANEDVCLLMARKV